MVIRGQAAASKQFHDELFVILNLEVHKFKFKMPSQKRQKLSFCRFRNPEGLTKHVKWWILYEGK
jgi:hypothetical protein